MNDGINRLLTNLEITHLSRLNVGSRFTVESQLQGAHPSPLKGFSVEFADYRQYVPGDDVRHVDWRVYGRSERLYIRQFEEECNLRLYILLDASKSMAFGHEEITKYTYGSRLAAALAYVTTHQQDSVGINVFNAKEHTGFPAKSSSVHLRTLANCMAEFEPAGETDLARSIHRVAESVQRRALIVLISDLYDDITQFKTSLAHLRRRKHDVIVYHVLDKAEIEFPFHDMGNFQDMETGERIITNPNGIREAYQQEVADFLRESRAVCSSLDIDYNLITTNHDLINVVRQHLHRRSR